MRILMTTLTVTLALVCSAVQAQAYRWVDKDGKVRYGDVPPPGAKATTLKAPPPVPATRPAKEHAGKEDAAAAVKENAKKDAKTGPLTPVEQEQAYRERQLKAKEAKEKEDLNSVEAERKKQNCASSQEALRGLERGGRLATINAQGETQYLDDAQRAARVEQARAAVAESCK